MSRYVLVHGSWHGGWVWDLVAPLLRSAGHEVATPDLAGRGEDRRPPAEVTLDDHVDVVVEALEASDRPAILVGHSFGGFVISHAAERSPDRIELLVYLAAFLLLNGETVLGVAGSVPPAVPHLDVREDAGLIAVRPDAAREVFYGDCSAEDADRATALLVPEALAPRRTPAELTEERFGRVPRVYLETLEDRALPIVLQRRMQAALPCREVMSLEAGHSPFFSMPRRLADRLIDLGRPTSRLGTDEQEEGNTMSGSRRPDPDGAMMDGVLDPTRCLLAVIDVQNDFCHEDGAFAKMGHPVDTASAVVPGIRKALDLARGAGIPRVLVRVAHSGWTDDPAWSARGRAGIVIDVERVPVAREGSWGAEFYEIEPDSEAKVLTKHRYSAFVHTPLELYLRAAGASTIVLAGVATDVCVHATARDALHAGFLPVVLEDATASHSAEAHAKALEDIRSFIGRVATVADLERAWPPTGSLARAVGASRT